MIRTSDISPASLFLERCLKIQHITQEKKFNPRNSPQLDNLIRQLWLMESVYRQIPSFKYFTDREEYMAGNKFVGNLIEYRLSDAEIDEMHAWEVELDLSYDMILAQLAALGYKISFTFVEKSASWCISITGQQHAKHNTGATITSWCDDPYEALIMGYYKVIVVFGGRTWQGRSRSNFG